MLQLEIENAQLKERLASNEVLLAQLVERLQTAEARIRELEARLAQDSHNSSKPPSSDGPARTPTKRSLRKASGKKPGGQIGHEGHALKQIEKPNQIVSHFPPTCQHCQADLTTLPFLPTYEPRQVFELPLPLKLNVIEHRAYSRQCPHCQQLTTAAFPKGVSNWVQYGPGFRALAVYLVEYQLLPYARVCDLLNEIYSETLSPGTLAALIAECAESLVEPEDKLKQALTKVKILHCDESGLRVEGRRYWFHVASTAYLTHYAFHRKRGKAATTEIGILPHFTGTAIHDSFSSYFGYECQHALCNAHHLRELTFLAEQLGQSWASEFKTLLLELKASVATALEAGQTALSPPELAEYELRYQKLIELGLAANPPPPGGWLRGKRGRPRQSRAKNLLDRLDKRREQVLLFAYRFDVPFDNNQAERDIRMVKVQQKISGCFRSAEGATYFCRIRSYLSTMKKQGENLLVALFQVFIGEPLLPTKLA